MRSIETTIDIDAPPETVWAVLTDTVSYPDWNPFITSLDGDLLEGARLRVRIQPPESRGVSLSPTVVAMTEGQELRWLGHLGFKGIFDGEHRFVLTTLDDGHTRFTQSEQFTGMLVPLVGGMLGKTRLGFESMNEALRVRAEQLSRCAP